jgi:hypothetical protein
MRMDTGEQKLILNYKVNINLKTISVLMFEDWDGWLGRVIRMNETMTVNKILEEKLGEGKEEGDVESGGLMMWKNI